MEDGSLAVGLFNLDERQRDLSISWSELRLAGPCRVRDLWRQQDVGVEDDTFKATVPRHGVALIRMWPQTGELEVVEAQETPE